MTKHYLVGQEAAIADATGVGVVTSEDGTDWVLGITNEGDLTATGPPAPEVAAVSPYNAVARGTTPSLDHNAVARGATPSLDHNAVARGTA